MNYKQFPEIPKIPKDLKEELIAKAIEMFEANNTLLYHRELETSDEQSLNYIPPHEFDFYNSSGGVTAIIVPIEQIQKLKQHYVDDPIIGKFNMFAFVIVAGGKYCSPHIDDSTRRKEGFQYVLKTGGSSVKTVWYKPKKEFVDYRKIDYCGIPYSKLDVVEEHCLEEDTWNFMNVNNIHSVENLESIRILLYGLTYVKDTQ